jgi:hypothetical protein
MKANSRIRFNPVTKEIEIEGSESFVKIYFRKIQEMVSGTAEKTVTAKKEPKAIKAAPAKKAGKKVKAAKAGPAKKAKKEAGVKRVTNIDTVVGLIQSSTEGISTSELKEKTELAESQIWNIVTRASKLGKIKKVKRGLYGAV